MQSTAELERHLSKRELIGVLELIDAASTAGSEQQFRHLMELTAKLIPLQGVHVCLATLDGQSNVVGLSGHILINFPKEFVEDYLGHGFAKVDGALAQLVESGRPLLWHEVRKRFNSKAHQALYRLADSYGLCYGLTFGCRCEHSPRISVFSATCDIAELPRGLRHLHVIEFLTPYLHAALSRVQASMLRNTPVLSERERQVMYWAKFGKTDSDIAMQLGISQRTVKFHITNAMRKLHASNRLQAAANALSQGLVGWD